VLATLERTAGTRRSDADPHRAKLAVETHLSRIAQQSSSRRNRRAGERATAANLRHWFAQEFLDALLD